MLSQAERDFQEEIRNLQDIDLRCSKRLNRIDQITLCVPKPCNPLPLHYLPKWENLPLNQKLPCIPCPPGEFQLARNQIGASLFGCNPGCYFDNEDPKILRTPIQYNSLHDPYLKEYFRKNPNVLCKLQRKGLINEYGSVHCSIRDFNKYRDYLSRLHSKQIHKERERWDQVNDGAFKQVQNIKKCKNKQAHAAKQEKCKQVKEERKATAAREDLLKHLNKMEQPSGTLKERLAEEKAYNKRRREYIKLQRDCRYAILKKAERERQRKMVLEWYCRDLYKDRLRKSILDYIRKKRLADLEDFIKCKREYQTDKIRYERALNIRSKAEKECAAEKRKIHYIFMEHHYKEQLKKRAEARQLKKAREDYLTKKYGRRWLAIMENKRRDNSSFHESLWMIRHKLRRTVDALKKETGAITFTTFIQNLVAMNPKKTLFMDDETRHTINYILTILLDRAFKEGNRRLTSCAIDFLSLETRQKLSQWKCLHEPTISIEDFVPPCIRQRAQPIPYVKPFWPCGPCAKFDKSHRECEEICYEDSGESCESKSDSSGNSMKWVDKLVEKQQRDLHIQKLLDEGHDAAGIDMIVNDAITKAVKLKSKDAKKSKDEKKSKDAKKNKVPTSSEASTPSDTSFVPPIIKKQRDELQREKYLSNGTNKLMKLEQLDELLKDVSGSRIDSTPAVEELFTTSTNEGPGIISESLFPRQDQIFSERQSIDKMIEQFRKSVELNTLKYEGSNPPTVQSKQGDIVQTETPKNTQPMEMQLEKDLIQRGDEPTSNDMSSMDSTNAMNGPGISKAASIAQQPITQDQQQSPDNLMSAQEETKDDSLPVLKSRKSQIVKASVSSGEPLKDNAPIELPISTSVPSETGFAVSQQSQPAMHDKSGLDKSAPSLQQSQPTMPDKSGLDKSAPSLQQSQPTMPDKSGLDNSASSEQSQPAMGDKSELDKSASSQQSLPAMGDKSELDKSASSQQSLPAMGDESGLDKSAPSLQQSQPAMRDKSGLDNSASSQQNQPAMGDKSELDKSASSQQSLPAMGDESGLDKSAPVESMTKMDSQKSNIDTTVDSTQSAAPVVSRASSEQPGTDNNTATEDQQSTDQLEPAENVSRIGSQIGKRSISENVGSASPTNVSLVPDIINEHQVESESPVDEPVMAEKAAVQIVTSDVPAPSKSAIPAPSKSAIPATSKSAIPVSTDQQPIDQIPEQIKAKEDSSSILESRPSEMANEGSSELPDASIIPTVPKIRSEHQSESNVIGPEDRQSVMDQSLNDENVDSKSIITNPDVPASKTDTLDKIPTQSTAQQSIDKLPLPIQVEGGEASSSPSVTQSKSMPSEILGAKDSPQELFKASDSSDLPITSTTPSGTAFVPDIIRDQQVENNVKSPEDQAVMEQLAKDENVESGEGESATAVQGSTYQQSIAKLPSQTKAQEDGTTPPSVLQSKTNEMLKAPDSSNLLIANRTSSDMSFVDRIIRQQRDLLQGEYDVISTGDEGAINKLLNDENMSRIASTMGKKGICASIEVPEISQASSHLPLTVLSDQSIDQVLGEIRMSVQDNALGYETMSQSVLQSKPIEMLKTRDSPESSNLPINKKKSSDDLSYVDRIILQQRGLLQKELDVILKGDERAIGQIINDENLSRIASTLGKGGICAGIEVPEISQASSHLQLTVPLDQQSIENVLEDVRMSVQANVIEYETLSQALLQSKPDDMVQQWLGNDGQEVGPLTSKENPLSSMPESEFTQYAPSTISTVGRRSSDLTFVDRIIRQQRDLLQGETDIVLTGDESAINLLALNDENLSRIASQMENRAITVGSEGTEVSTIDEGPGMTGEGPGVSTSLSISQQPIPTQHRPSIEKIIEDFRKSLEISAQEFEALTQSALESSPNYMEQQRLGNEVQNQGDPNPLGPSRTFTGPLGSRQRSTLFGEIADTLAYDLREPSRTQPNQDPRRRDPQVPMRTEPVQETTRTEQPDPFNPNEPGITELRSDIRRGLNQIREELQMLKAELADKGIIRHPDDTPGPSSGS